MESILFNLFSSAKITLLIKLGILEPFNFSPQDGRTQLILLILFILLMHFAEKYDLLGLRKNAAKFEKDDGIQNET